MSYEVIVTAVRDRADLLVRTVGSMLPLLDVKPARVVVHEDVRPGVECPRAPTTREMLAEFSSRFDVPIVVIERNPGGGLGRAVLRLLEEARTEFVLYTQEDFDFVRAVPVGECLALMRRRNLNHVRFNKRKTMRIKGEHHADRAKWWTKQTLDFDGQPLTISDHWYFQASMWRRSLALDGFRQMFANVAGGVAVDRCEAKFNHWLNQTIGKGCGSVDGDQDARADLVKTFIWGAVGEPPFIQHTGHDRRSQGWPDPEKRGKNS